jgi:DNA-binding CsgD family transcriptional regulator
VTLSGPWKPSLLFGRDEALAEVLHATASVVLVTGPPGIGRTTVLNTVRSTLDQRGIPTLGIRLTPSSWTRPGDLVFRFNDELLDLRPSALDEQPTGCRDLTVALRQLAGGLEAHRGQLAVFVDDLHWADPTSLNMLSRLVHTVAGTSVKFVCGYRTSPGIRVLTNNLVHLVRLRPLRTAEVISMLTRLLLVVPEHALSARIRRLSRGIPEVIEAAVEGYRRAGAWHVIDRHVYLAPADASPVPPANHPVFAHLREPAAPAWAMLKALAVLQPLGEAAPALIAEAADVDEAQVLVLLGKLLADGVVLTGPRPGQWRLRVPLVGDLLTACLGPYERRNLARIAVTALWAETASTKDSRYRAEQLIAAGRLVDAERAAGELLAYCGEITTADPALAQRAAKAAADLFEHPERRTTALFQHIIVCRLRKDFSAAAESVRTLLAIDAERFGPELLCRLEVVKLLSWLAAGDRTALTQFTEQGWQSTLGGEANQIVCRAIAFCFSDRWDWADGLLQDAGEALKRSHPPAAGFARLFGAIAAMLRGKPAALDELMAEPEVLPMFAEDNVRQDQLAGYARLLLLGGEADRAGALLARYLRPREQPMTEVAAVQASLAGDWDTALRLARETVTASRALGNVLAYTVVVRETTTILLARAQLTSARAAIENARATNSLLPHLLAVPEAALECLIGSRDKAHRLIRASLVWAEERGLVAGLDDLWAWRARHYLVTSAAADAERCVGKLGFLARQTGTGRARLNHLAARSEVLRDSAATNAMIGLARERAQPFELANILVLAGTADPGRGALLGEAYELFGALDALIPRAHLRQMMRFADVAVPGRASTVAENERLLATLVADGMTNKELASILRASEKSVEGRLSRLFQRTGYRSRVEVATAILDRSYPLPSC